MEMICASTCLTSMICFSMEVKYGNMLDSKLSMQRHRVGARGNATTFLLPHEILLAELQRLDDQAKSQEQRTDLPRNGEQLKYVVQVLLKTNDEDQRDNLKHFIHQARVRQRRVIEVIMAMKKIGHKSYVNINDEAVKDNAAQLPTDGIPPELISLLPNDRGFDKLRMQKAATPVEGMKSSLKEASERFKEDRPNAVVLERSAAEEGDVKIRQLEALKSLAEMLGRKADIDKETDIGDASSNGSQKKMQEILQKNAYSTSLQLAVTWVEKKDLLSFLCTSHVAGHIFQRNKTPAKYSKVLKEKLLQQNAQLFGLRRIIVATGSEMQNQFVPWYFGVAFAFIFKYCTGMPDMPEWSKKPRHKRSGDAPRVDFPLWTRLMTRRVEQQVQRDWLLGFTMSSVLFHSQLNQCRTVYSYEKHKREDGSTGFTSQELESAAIQIVRALEGTYEDAHGRKQKVNGDFTKLRHVKTLDEAARRLLQNLEHTGRQLRGTMEIRKLMRYQTHAARIRRGVPIFLTFSPDEKHNMLMLRLHRARKHDPVYEIDSANLQYGNREKPSLDNDYVDASLSIEDLKNMLPTYDDRRAIMARNPLASVDGFWFTVRLVCELVLGMRVCPNCPRCNHMSWLQRMTDITSIARIFLVIMHIPMAVVLVAQPVSHFLSNRKSLQVLYMLTHKFKCSVFINIYRLQKLCLSSKPLLRLPMWVLQNIVSHACLTVGWLKIQRVALRPVNLFQPLRMLRMLQQRKPTVGCWKIQRVALRPLNLFLHLRMLVPKRLLRNTVAIKVMCAAKSTKM